MILLHQPLRLKHIWTKINTVASYYDDFTYSHWFYTIREQLILVKEFQSLVDGLRKKHVFYFFAKG